MKFNNKFNQKQKFKSLKHVYLIMLNKGFEVEFIDTKASLDFSC